MHEQTHILPLAKVMPRNLQYVIQHMVITHLSESELDSALLVNTVNLTPCT